MSGLSPASILYSSDGYELATINGSAIPSGTRGILLEGSDGTNSRFVTVDSSGRLVVVGNTAAGSGAATGLITIQGNASGTPVPVSGTVTATNASVSTTGTAPPGSATYIGGSVTTAAPSYTTGQMNALSLTTTGLLRIDGSGVTQPVSGTVTANIGTTNGLALDVTLAKLTIAQSTALGSNTQALVGGSVTTAAPSYTTGNINPLSLTTAGALRVDGSAVNQPVIGTGSAGTPATGVVTVQGIAGGKSIPVTTDVTSVGTITSVVGANSSTTLLASNANRVSATIYNDSNKSMYIALSSTASTTAFTVLVLPNSYWELPASYTGAISAIWLAGVSGSARITELT